ncbi:tetratricopeptide repeat protein [bacterium]|nr:MAG: tetratricopeptide repeat protein [bacterium]
MEGPSVWRVSLLGPPALESGVRLRTAKHRAVLASFLLDSAPLGRTEIALRFWPDQSDPLNHLRQAVADIRHGFGAEVLVVEGKTLRLRDREQFRTDTDELQECLSEARRAADPAERLSVLQIACGLGTGDFLEGLEDSEAGGWLTETRERVHGWLADANVEYAHALEAKGEFSEAWLAASEAMRWNPGDAEVSDTVLRLSLAIDARRPATLAGGRSLEETAAVLRRAEKSGRTPNPQEARTLLAAFGVRLVANEALRSVALALSGFKAPFTAEQARTIAGVRVADLQALVANRVLSEVDGRYAMVESLRRVLWKDLSPDEQEQFAARHARNFARWVREPRNPEAEKEHLALALHWHLANSKAPSVLAFLGRLYDLGLFDVCAMGGDWCVAFLRKEREAPPLRREAAWLAGRLALARHRFAEAVAIFETAVALAEEAPSQLGRADLLFHLSYACHHASRPKEAEAWARRSVVEAKRVGDQAGLAQAYRFLGEILRAAGRLRQALECVAEAVEIDEATPSSVLGETLFQLATLQSLLHRPDEAYANFVRSLESRLELGNPHGTADCLRGMALIQARRGQTVEAWANARHALELYRSMGKIASSAAALGDLAEVHICRGETEKALDRLEEALAIWKAEPHAGWTARVERRMAELLEGD